MALLERRIMRECAYYKLDKLVLEMRQAKTGIPMKQLKGLFSTVSHACSGRELMTWLHQRLQTSNESEAVHIATHLVSLGYLIPVSDRTISLRVETSCLRIQRPALWPSRKWESTSHEYAVYLLKKTLTGKQLENHEQTALNSLETIHANNWVGIKQQAQDAVSKYNLGSRTDKEIDDSQERAFWRIHRPASGAKVSREGFPRNNICMEFVNQNRKMEVLKKKIHFMKIYLDRAMGLDQTGEKTINVLSNHSTQYLRHDPLLSSYEARNPWIVIDEYLHEDVHHHDDESKKISRLDIETWALGFRELLKDPQGKQLFSIFLQQEYSRENLLFWEACEDLKQSPQSRVPTRVAKIHKDFLLPNSNHEVNLDRDVLQRTLLNLQSDSRYCMDEAQLHIYSLMKEDCYPRFLKSEFYQQLLLQKDDIKKAALKKVKYLKRLPFNTVQRQLQKQGVARRSLSPGRRATAESFDIHQKYLSSSNLMRPPQRASPRYIRKENDTKGESPFPLRKAGSLSSLVLNSDFADVDNLSTDSGIAINRSRPGSMRKIWSNLSLKKRPS